MRTRPTLQQIAKLALAALILPLSAVATAAPAQAVAPDVSVSEVKAELQKFAQIAAANGGNRAVGRPGYKASADYVAAELRAAGYTVTLQSFMVGFATTWNVIAEKTGTVGANGPVLMLGGHLDSVTSGPGINDNGSGSAALLAVAKKYAASGATPTNNLRFAFWGAEETGLNGSKFYNSKLSSAQRSQIKAYFNFDMIASPNAGYFVYNDNPAGNGLRDYLTAWYDARGIAWEYIDVQGRSDHASFRAAGLPTAGIFSGAEEIMSAAQAAKWGGVAGKAFDACYHLACDNLSNINDLSLDRSSDLIASVVWDFTAKELGPVQALTNPSFEQGSVGWSGNTETITDAGTWAARTGTWKAVLGGKGTSNTQTLGQSFTLPAGASGVVLKFNTRISSREFLNLFANDKLTVTLGGQTLLTLSNQNSSSSYVARQVALPVSGAGDYRIEFTSRENNSAATSFVLDDVTVEYTR